MVLSLLEWALKCVIATFFLLLLSLLLWFVWNTVMSVMHGPELGFINIAFLAFLAAIAVGSWGFSFLPARVARTQ
jgi:tryptophan-rich sensory protein